MSLASYDVVTFLRSLVSVSNTTGAAFQRGGFQWPNSARDEGSRVLGDTPDSTGSAWVIRASGKGFFGFSGPIARAAARLATGALTWTFLGHWAPDADSQGRRCADAEQVAHAGQNYARLKLNFRRPSGFVDFDRERRTMQRPRFGMRRHDGADDAVPRRQDVSKRHGCFESSGAEEMLGGVADPKAWIPWPIVRSPRPAGCQLRTPSSRWTTRSGDAPGGNAPAVVSNACPSGSSLTSARAVWSSSSEKASSRSRTGATPVTSVT